MRVVTMVTGFLPFLLSEMYPGARCVRSSPTFSLSVGFSAGVLSFYTHFHAHDFTKMYVMSVCRAKHIRRKSKEPVTKRRGEGQLGKSFQQ